MATQDMVDFHCELFDRCINHSDDKEDNNDQKEFEMSKDALDVANSVKKVCFQGNICQARSYVISLLLTKYQNFL